MRDRILEIVLLLIDYLQEQREYLTDIDDISSQLETLGYSDHEISTAYNWLLERYGAGPEEHFRSFPKMHLSNRVLTPGERRLLTCRAHGFLIRLIHMGIIDDARFEVILDRLAALDQQPATLAQTKLVTSAVVFDDVEGAESLNMFDRVKGSSPHIN
jgi:uncharacterized protein Smg (DUF494 family)